MYSIVNIIYGTHINNKTEKKLKKMLDQMYDNNEIPYAELEELGFETMYSGTGDTTVAYLGVKLDSFDAIAGTSEIGFPLSKLKLQPTKQQKEKAEKIYQKLSEEVRAILPPLDVYVVVSTS